MTQLRALGRGRRWLLPLLVAALVLGHVCDVPAYALLAGHQHLGHDHVPPAAGHSHEGEPAVACQAVAVAPGHGGAFNPDQVFVASAPPAVIGVTGLVVDGWLVPNRARPTAALPLFLLFSSLLI